MSGEMEMCATDGCGGVAIVMVEDRWWCSEHVDGRTRGVWRNLSFALMSQVNARRCVRWHGPDWKSPDDQWTAADWSNAMCGEAGEAANIVKKLRRLEGSFPSTVPSLPRERLTQELADELADVVLYADLLAQKVGIDLGDAVRRKFNRKSHEQGFEERI